MKPSSLNQKDLAFIQKCSSQTYAKQAKLFLNAFWSSMEAKAEEVWQFHLKYIDTDLHLKGLTPPYPEKEGTQLNEHGFHVFLERHLKALTVLEARAKLREADADFDGNVSLIEFLNWHFKKRTVDFIKAAPSDPAATPYEMTPELQAAQNALNAVRTEISKIENEKRRLREEAAGTGIKAMKAKNELAQINNRDNTDLNRALLTAEAAVRKAGGSGIDIPPGSLWWMQRELEEMKKYRPGGR